MSDDARTDEQLLASTAKEPEAFALFYRRHAAALTGFFLRRTRDPELAADLTAETFAAALVGIPRYDARRGPAVGWLYGIGRNLLAGSWRHGVVEDRARRRLGMATIVLDDEAIARIEALGGDEAVAALDDLPADQRAAVRARVLDEREYADIALTARTSESVIRKRVSRGLAGLRARMEEPRP
jgi:RNA polymerase sigma factor (sigma-70 family)